MVFFPRSPAVAFSVLLLVFGLLPSTHSAATDTFIHIGEGSLLSVEGAKYYGTVVYGRVGKSGSVIKATMEEAAKQFDDFCVGYMYHAGSGRGGLMFDMSKIGSSIWPPTKPAALSSARQSWFSKSGSLWQGNSIVSLTASKAAGKGWIGWMSYAKLHLIAVTQLGEGTLISMSGTTWYAVMQYKDIGSSVDEVRDVMMRAVIEAGDACVGFHMRPIQSGGRYLQAALLYDRNKISAWPVPPPDALVKATEVWKADWPGTGEVSYDLSINVGKGWDGWQCYAKVEIMYDPVVYAGEGTLLDGDDNYYGVVQYREIADSERNLWCLIRRAYIECGSRCVGFHYRPVPDGRYLEAALLYDRGLAASWPMPAPTSLTGATTSWTSPESGSLWLGTGLPSATTSAPAGKGWNGWQCYVSA